MYAKALKTIEIAYQHFGYVGQTCLEHQQNSDLVCKGNRY